MMDMVTHKEMEALGLLIELKDYYGLQDWSAGFNNRVHSLGVTRFKKKRIELSRNLIKHSSDEVIEGVIRHEIAHALEWDRYKTYGHGRRWKIIALEVGADPQATTHDADYMRNVESKYTLICDACGARAPVSRRLKNRYMCRDCWRKRGEKHELRLIQNW